MAPQAGSDHSMPIRKTGRSAAYQLETIPDVVGAVAAVTRTLVDFAAIPRLGCWIERRAGS